MNAPDQSAAPSPPAARILHAEDDAVVAHAVDLVLRKGGHHVDWVDNGTEALARIQTHPNRYSLLITDQNMPGHSGVQLVASLQKTNFCGEVIVWSSVSSGDVGAQFSSLGVKHQLSKSQPLGSLLSLVQQVLSEPEATQS